MRTSSWKDYRKDAPATTVATICGRHVVIWTCSIIKVMSLGILRSAEKLWLPTIRETMLGAAGSDAKPSDAVVLKRAFLVWADAGNAAKAFVASAAVQWPWAGEVSSGFSRSSSHGLTVLLPLIDLTSAKVDKAKDVSSFWVLGQDLSRFLARSSSGTLSN